jgi:Domain of Unknown Function (DUF928)
MKKLKLSASVGRLISALLLPILLAADLNLKSWADQKTAASFEPPPGRDAPRSGTAGGGSHPVRTSCASKNTSATNNYITAISPGSHLGLTQVERPSFIVYLSPTIAQTAEFSLFDEEMNGVYQANVPVANQTGLVSIALPDSAPALAKEQRYYWTVALICNPNDRTEDVVVGGWIERAEANENFKQQLANLPALERVSLYAKQGFWYDAVNLLLELKQAQPNNTALSASWEELIKSVGLEVSTNLK